MCQYVHAIWHKLGWSGDRGHGMFWIQLPGTTVLGHHIISPSFAKLELLGCFMTSTALGLDWFTVN